MFFALSDWGRAIILLFFLEGMAYVLFPAAIQGYAVRILADAPARKLRMFGILMIVIGFVLCFFASKSFSAS